MNQPLVSVVMPMYNASAHVATAIQSVLNQTYNNLELIIVDDDSDDNSIDIAHTFKSMDRRVHILHAGPRTKKNHRRVSLAANLGIKQANGSFIARMDADDLSLSTRIETQVQFLLKNPDIDACGMNANLLTKRTWKESKAIMPVSDEAIKAHLLAVSPFIHSSVMMRTEIFKHKDIWYDEELEYAEDYDFMVRLADHCKLANIPTIGVIYRIHHAQSIHTNEHTRLAKAIIIRQIGKYFDLTHEDKEIHYRLMSHRTDYDLSELEATYQWMLELAKLNDEREVFDPVIFKKFLHERWIRKIMTRKSYSFQLLLALLSRSKFPIFRSLSFPDKMIYSIKSLLHYKASI